MYRPYNLLALVVVYLSSWSAVSAHSTHAPLLKRAINPRTLALDIAPRRPQLVADPTLQRRSTASPYTLRHDDTFRLTIAAFDDTFHLHLRPNDHLVHPAARVNYYTLDSDGNSVLDRTEPLVREDIKVYLGEVIAPHHTDERFKEDTAGLVHAPNHPAERGWARIMVHDQGDASTPPTYEGAFSANGVTYHILTKDNFMRKKRPLDSDIHVSDDLIDGNLVIWKDTDVMSPDEEHFVKTGTRPTEPIPYPQTCGHDSLEHNQNHPVVRPPPPAWLNVLLRPRVNGTVYRRQDIGTGGNSGMETNFLEYIGQKAGCPVTQKMIYMGVAADCEYVNKQGGPKNAKTQILNTWNAASALYKTTFNVSLGITVLEVQTAVCPSAVDRNIPWNIPCSSANLDTRLSIFSQWRGTRAGDQNGLWHLMSGCPSGPEVGIAWLATVCRDTATNNRNENRFVSGTAVSTYGPTEWQVVAHEIGHNFGAIHDCNEGCASSSVKCCPLSGSQCDAKDQFIMSPTARPGDKVFSQCSLGNVCALMRGGVDGNPSSTDVSCLVDPDPTRQSITLQMCGNGIVEPGEDCDPGLGRESPCCNPTTCKFTTNAVCDPESTPCCTAQCQFAPSTQICRPSRDATCDTEERCTGTSAACPADVVAPNGKVCGAGELKCASGTCTSVAAQCKLVGGSMGLEKECPDHSEATCQITCQDPKQENACKQLSSLLSDGSPCGYAGTCTAGKCIPGHWFETFKAWYRYNLQIAIPVSIVAGLIALLILWAIIRGISRCCGGSRTRTTTRPISMVIPAVAAQHQRLNSREPPTRNVLRNAPPEARSQYARVPPPAAHDRTRSQGYNEGYTYNYNANNRTNWVDDREYNGTGGWR